ncbi:hypothetical protein GGR28_003560 [Lewinella aquimaris]|uniref:TonB-dependent receptor plug domain-containing protein n=1 Tax=Neolewinella aquimaris TaxID=1835722 RepID=A0A840E6X8_9BACT|nr:hypothetical protein [Neolewinella aquimaris]MBB4080921.1 hypothetical protein [Neolewinella aquimaris]
MIRSLLFVPAVLLTAGLLAQDSLSFGGIDLPGAEVRASYRKVSPLAQAFTIEEVRRLPATFYDPARLIALLPGTVQTNDQANHLSVRGNSPNANLWRLNGLAIANPNHTSNAGTFYDFPTLGGGGVNALSAQVLDNSAFVAAGLPTRYGNATGGTFDLRLRPGSKERRQHQLQASFIGFDAATEGPLGRNGQTSYLVNGRYSFTGLLANAGVDFGGEAIGFSDLNVHLHHQLPTGELSVFGVLGTSSNTFTPDPEEAATEQKELFDIDYTNDIGIGGVSYRTRLPIGEVNAGVGYSRTTAQRLQQFTQGGGRNAYHQSQLNRLSAHLDLERVITTNLSLSGGVEVLADGYQQTLNFYDRDTLTNGSALQPTVTSIAPHLQGTYIFGAFDLDLGIRLVHYGESSLLDEWIAEPRLRLRRRWEDQRIVVVAERTSQTPYAGLLLGATAMDRFVPVNNQLSLAYGRSIGPVSALISTYFQYSPEEYAAEVGDFLLSANNFLEFDPSFSFRERTATRRYGVEIEVGGGKRQEGWYYRGSSSVFRAETQQTGGNWAKDRYSSDVAAKLVLGREWAGENRRQRDRTYGLNLALIAHGGERSGIVTGIYSGTVNPYFAAPDYRQGFINSNGTYFRPDLRLYRTIRGEKTTKTLALDLQNVAGISNTALRYYDVVIAGPNERQALGLIPVLSYRVFWR